MQKELDEILRSFVNYTVKRIIPENSPIEIIVIKSMQTIIIQIKVSQKDRGRIIGKKGVAIRSLKVLTTVIKNSNFPEDNRKINIEVVDEEDYAPKK